MATSESLLSMCREITRPEYVVIGIYKPRLFPALSSTGINYKLTVLGICSLTVLKVFSVVYLKLRSC